MRNIYSYDACACGRAKAKQSKQCRACFWGTSVFQGSLADLVWARVDSTGGRDACWPWRGTIAWNGYGYFRRSLAHRLVWELVLGAIPLGLFVCHHCDNPPCCNPRHMFLGSNADNMADAVAKGRMRRGSRHPYARMTEESIREIRARVAEGALHREVAQEFGVTRRYIGDIVSRKTWAWLPDVREARPAPLLGTQESAGLL